MEPMDQYSNIQFLVKKEIDDAITSYASRAKFNIAQIPAHPHDGISSERINYNDLLNTPKQFCYQTTRAINSASGTTSIPHNLLLIPKYAKIIARGTSNSEDNKVLAGSDGFSDGVNNCCTVFSYMEYLVAGTQSSISSNVSSSSIYVTFYDSTGDFVQQKATITFDEQYINLIFVKSGTSALYNENINITLIVTA